MTGHGIDDVASVYDTFPRLANEIVAEVMREHGETEMAEALLGDREWYIRLCDSGRERRHDA